MADEPQRQQTIDPAVADIMSDLERRRAEAHLSPRERKKKAREREKIRKRRSRRTTYDLPPRLRQRIAEIGEQHRVPASQVAALLLEYGLAALEKGEIDLEARKVPSKSPRYDWNLDLAGESED